MRARHRALIALVVTVAGMVAARELRAEGPAPKPDAETKAPSPDALAAAKQLFIAGNERLDAGDFEGAFMLFARSRELVPSIANTTNAALALEKMGRVDEAIDMYDLLLAQFGAKLTADEKQGVARKVAALRGQVGTLEITSPLTGGVVVVDGRRRGKVPLSAPLRVVPGWHVIRVVRDGFTPAEASVEVMGGRAVRVEVTGGEALAAVGRLQVTVSGDTEGQSLELVVDGAPVGAAPWQGALGPGRHVVWLRGRDRGTAPVEVNVVAGQTTPFDAKVVPLGPQQHISVEPRSARIAIDGVDVGNGAWGGRLPRGTHVAIVTEEGYQTARIDLPVAGASAAAPTLVALVIDEGHPRWGRSPRARLQVDALLGGALGPHLDGGAESNCTTCGDAWARGGSIEARFSYVFPVGLRVEASGGYLGVVRTSDRTLATNPTSTYEFRDRVALSGPFATLGLGFGIGLADKLDLEGRLAFGAFFATARDTIEARATASGQPSLPLYVDKSGQQVTGATVFFAPELGVVRRQGNLALGLSLGASYFLLDGPSLPLGEVGPQAAPSTPCKASDLACLKGSTPLEAERAFGRFFLLTPKLSAGWQFLRSNGRCAVSRCPLPPPRKVACSRASARASAPSRPSRRSSGRRALATPSPLASGPPSHDGRARPSRQPARDSPPSPRSARLRASRRSARCITSSRPRAQASSSPTATRAWASHLGSSAPDPRPSNEPTRSPSTSTRPAPTRTCSFAPPTVPSKTSSHCRRAPPPPRSPSRSPSRPRSRACAW